MAKKYPQFPLKIDPNYLDKMKYIANENGRSTNKEIEQLIIRYIKEYEKAYGEIEKVKISFRGPSFNSNSGFNFCQLN